MEAEQAHCVSHTYWMHVRDFQHVDFVGNVLLPGQDFTIMCNTCVRKLGRNQQLLVKTRSRRLSTDFEFRSFCNLHVPIKWLTFACMPHF